MSTMQIGNHSCLLCNKFRGGSKMTSEGVWFDQFTILTLCIPKIQANSVDPDQMPQNVASDQGLHCLPLI